MSREFVYKVSHFYPNVQMYYITVLHCYMQRTFVRAAFIETITEV